MTLVASAARRTSTSAVAVEQPYGQPSFFEVADRLTDDLRDYRVEVTGHRITVTPSAGIPHGRSVKPARTGIPVHVVMDRGNRRMLVLTDPRDGEQRVQAGHRPGRSVTLPASIGAEVIFEVNDVLGPE